MKTIRLKILFQLLMAIVTAFLIVHTASALDYHYNCSWCHDFHFAQPGTTLLNSGAADANAVCTSCHSNNTYPVDENGTYPYPAPVVGPNHYNSAFCIDCHDVHKNRRYDATNRNVALVGFSMDADDNRQGDNLAEVINLESNPGARTAVKFTEKCDANSQWSDDAISNSICVGCHGPTHRMNCNRCHHGHIAGNLFWAEGSPSMGGYSLGPSCTEASCESAAVGGTWNGSECLKPRDCGPADMLYFCDNQTDCEANAGIWDLDAGICTVP